MAGITVKNINFASEYIFKKFAPRGNLGANCLQFPADDGLSNWLH